MTDPVIDAAYNVRATVSSAVFERAINEYRTQSEQATAGLAGVAGVHFDNQSDECLDIWGTGKGLRPVVIAIHGGYWRALSRHDTAFMARVLSDVQVATVVPDYTLAPHATLEEIVRQVRACVAWTYHLGAEHGLDPERIFVLGSSAGGHLAAMTLVAGDWHYDLGLPANVLKGGLLISGLFDLRPLVDSFANEWLGLDAARAMALSPLLRADLTVERPPVVVAVAEHDGTGFIAQSHTFNRAWSATSASTRLVIPGKNHYDVFLDLADADSNLTRALVDILINPDT